MSYAQLSAFERNQIYDLSTTTALSIRAIARRIGRDQSTVSRELARNRNEEGHCRPFYALPRLGVCGPLDGLVLAGRLAPTRQGAATVPIRPGVPVQSSVSLAQGVPLGDAGYG